MGKQNSKIQQQQGESSESIICVHCALNKNVNQNKNEMQSYLSQYIQEEICERYPYISKKAVKYLQDRNVALDKDSILLCISQRILLNDDKKNKITQQIKEKLCYIVDIHSKYDSEFQTSLIDSIKANKSLLKISIQQDSDQNVSSFKTLEQFSELIKYFDQSTCLQSLYYKQYINVLRIDIELQLFQLEVNFLSVNKDDNIDDLRLFPFEQRCKFVSVELILSSDWFKNRVDTLISFLDLNQNSLRKAIIHYKNEDEDQIIQLLDKLTQMNEQFHILEECRISFSKKYYEIEADLSNYIVRNQNLRYYTINYIGINQTTLQIEINMQQLAKCQHLIIKLIKEIPAVSQIHLPNPIQTYGEFMEMFEHIPDRRVRLQLDSDQFYRSNQKYKFLKQLSHNQYFEIQFQKLTYISYDGELLFTTNILYSYQNEIILYMIINIILKKHLQKQLHHRAQNSFIDLYIDQN